MLIRASLNFAAHLLAGMAIGAFAAAAVRQAVERREHDSPSPEPPVEAA